MLLNLLNPSEASPAITFILSHTSTHFLIHISTNPGANDLIRFCVPIPLHSFCHTIFYKLPRVSLLFTELA